MGHPQLHFQLKWKCNNKRLYISANVIFSSKRGFYLDRISCITVVYLIIAPTSIRDINQLYCHVFSIYMITVVSNTYTFLLFVINKKKSKKPLI